MFWQLALLSLLLIQSGHWSAARATNLQNSDSLEEYLIDKIKDDPATYKALLAAKKSLEKYAGGAGEEEAMVEKAADTYTGDIAKDVKDPSAPETGGVQETPLSQQGGTGGDQDAPLSQQEGTGGKADVKGGEEGAPTPTKNSSDHTPLPPQHVQGQPPGSGGVPVTPGNDMVFIAVVAACSVAGLVGIVMAGVCWYKLHRSAKAASEVDYPAYGVTGPSKDRLPSPGDRKLAQSAQMYHYQHQKQQMIAMEKANGEMKHDASDEESEEENEEGDYTVYECPGLAPTGEMEVKNPLFSDETPVTPGGDDRHDMH